MKTTLPCLLIAVIVITAGCDSSRSPTRLNAVTEDSTWNDTSRDDLRESLRNRVLGELRLAKSHHGDIIQLCREVYIDDECPEDEREAFIRFAREELDKAATKHSMEQETLKRCQEPLSLVSAYTAGVLAAMHTERSSAAAH
jgi:hypothetical protein